MSERSCSSCGAALPDGAQFCTACGTPAPAPPTQAVPVPAPPAPPAPPIPDLGPDPTTVMPTASPWAQPEPVAPAAPPPWQPAPTSPPPWQPAPTSQSPWQPAGSPPTAPQPGPPSQWGAPATGTFGAAGPATYTTAPAKRSSNVLGGLLALFGALLLLGGAFAPWVRTNIDTYSGWTVSDDAKAVLAVGMVSLVLAMVVFAGVRSVFVRLLLVGLGIAAIAIAVVDITSIGNDLPDSLNAKFGAGLVIVPIGGALVLISGIVTRRAKG